MSVKNTASTSLKIEKKKRGISSRAQKSAKQMENEVRNAKNMGKNFWIEHTDKTVKVVTLDMPQKQPPEQVLMEAFGKDFLPAWLTEKNLDCGFLDYYWNLDPDNVAKQKEKHTYIWMPVKIKPGLPEYSIFYTCVNKIDYLETLYNKFPDSNSKVKIAIREMQDRFQMLTLHMEMTGRYKNSELQTECMNYKEGSSKYELRDPVTNIPILEMFHPYESGSEFTVNCEPDLSPWLSYMELWGIENPIPVDNDTIAMIIHILSKCLPTPSKRRSVAKGISECWSDAVLELCLKENPKVAANRHKYSDTAEMIVRMMVGTLLGVYDDHTNNPANFHFRRKVYKWFCMFRPDRKELSKWIVKYNYFVIYSIREYLFYMVRNTGGLHYKLINTTYWASMARNAFTANDMFRRKMNESMQRYYSEYSFTDDWWDKISQDLGCFYSSHSDLIARPNGGHDIAGTREGDGKAWRIFWMPGQPWFNQAQGFFEDYNKISLQKAYRPKNMTFEQTVLTKMVKIETDKKRYKKVNPYAMEPELCVPKEIFYLMEDLIDRCHPFEELSFNWLASYPIAFDGEIIEFLQIGKKLYEMETKGSVLKDCIELMYVFHPYEYNVLKKLCQLILKKRRTMCYTLPDEFLEKQLSVSKWAYQTPPGEKLDDCAGMYYVCLHCGKIKITVRDYSTLNNPHSIGGWSSEGVCINVEDGNLYCTNINAKDNPKKRPNNSTSARKKFRGNRDYEFGQEIEEKKVRKTKEARDQENKEWDDMLAESLGLDKEMLGLEASDDGDSDVEDVRLKRSHVAPGFEPGTLIQHKGKTIPIEEYVPPKKDKYKIRRQQQVVCLHSEVVPLSLPGRVLLQDDGQVLLCPQCIHVMYYDPRMFRNGTSKISCGCMDKKSEAEINCLLCNAVCWENAYVRVVLDDTIEKWELKWITLCAAHKCEWMETANRLVTMSELRRQFEEKLHATIGPDGGIDFSRGSKKRKIQHQNDDSDSDIERNKQSTSTDKVYGIERHKTMLIDMEQLKILEEQAVEHKKTRKRKKSVPIDTSDKIRNDIKKRKVKISQLNKENNTQSEARNKEEYSDSDSESEIKIQYTTAKKDATSLS